MSDVEEAPNCGHAENNASSLNGLRIGAIFIILVTSAVGTFLPILTSRWKIPTSVYEFVKYFGSGVIIATAFIHLLAPAFEELGSPCLSGAWTEYSWASAIAMMSVFALFFLELFAFRWGSSIISGLGSSYDSHPTPHSHTHASHSNVHPKPFSESEIESGLEKQLQVASNHVELRSEDSLAKLVGIAILEFGVMFHSVIIGLTLAVDEEFKTLFVVIIFHQMFEGLGLGTRLATMSLPHSYAYVPYVGALLYTIMTPIGLAIGLGVRSTYNAESATANAVTGTLDAISAGVLLYTGLVELLAHEFLFNPKMHTASTGKIVYCGVCILTGAGLMALLGRWA